MLRVTNPLTALGVLALLLAVAGYLAGWQLGWIELIVLASGCTIALLIAAMYYVPMAQMRQASTGKWRAFYEFKIVWQLIRTRWLACLGLSCAVIISTGATANWIGLENEM